MGLSWKIIFFLLFYWMGSFSVFAQSGLDLKGFEELHCDQYDSTYMIALSNNSDASLFQENSYGIDFGDGTTVVTGKSYSEISDLIHTYSDYGEYELVFSALSKATGQLVSRTYKIAHLGTPALGLGDEKMVISCVGTNAILWATNFEDNPSSTVYTIDFGDDSRVETYTQAELLAQGGAIEHQYKSSHCRVSDEGFLYEIRATNVCDYNNPKMGRYKVVVPPKADFEYDEPICVNTPLNLVNKSQKGQNAECTEVTKYQWYVDGKFKGDGVPPDVSFLVKGNHTVKLIASNGPHCSIDSVVKSFEVFDEVVVDYQISEDTVCVNEPVILTSLASGYLRHSWIITSTNGYYQEFSEKNKTVRFSECGVYNIQLYVEGKCTPKAKDTTLVVRKDPEITFERIDTLCPGEVLSLNRTLVNYNWNCNDSKAAWELVDPDAARYTSDVPYPSFTLNKGGKYVVTVKLEGAKCPAERVEATQEIWVHDTTFVRDIRQSAYEICSGETVTFENRSSAHRLTYEWKPQIGSRIDFVAPSNGHSASPTFRFGKYGTFVIAANLKAVCNQVWNPVFEVKVIENPVVRLKLEPKICPQELDLSVGGYVEYDWKENPPHAVWKIEPEDEGCKIVENINGIYPRIRFRDPKEYKITVMLDSLGCPAGERSSASQIVQIFDDAKDLAISASDTAVCVQEEVVLSNTSTATASEIAKYHWSIDPPGAVNIIRGDTNERMMVVSFEEDGVYEVKGSVESCGSMDSVFRIHVKRNPEVQFNLPDTICPGLYDMCNYTAYTWYKNLHQVKWEMEGGCSLAAGSAETDTCPVIKMQPGFQRVVVTLKDVAVCRESEDKTQQLEEVYVRDSSLHIAITPSATDMCLADTLHFSNHTTGGEAGIRYLWRVEEADARIIGSAEAAEPDFVFSTYGTFHISVTITAAGGCNVKRCDFEIIVRDFPEVDFKKLENICFGTSLEINAEKIGYKPHNCDLTYEWSVNPVERNIITTPHAAYTDIHFSKPGTYRVKVIVGAQCGDSSYVQSVNVLDNYLEPRFSASVNEGCTPLGVDFTNESLGDSLSFCWKIVPEKRRVYVDSDSTMENPSVRFDSAGNYNVKLIISNLCRTDSVDHMIKAYSPPVILPDLLDIRDVCEKGYLFKGEDMLEVNRMNDDIVKVEWIIMPAEGVFYENGTHSESMYPDLRFEAGIYHLKGKYWNRCANYGEVIVNVTADTFYPVVLPYRDTSVCSETDPFLLQAEPGRGIWLSEEGMVRVRDENYYFDPYVDADKDYPVVYIFQHKSCIDKDTLTVRTIALPVVNAGPDQDICINNDPRMLIPVEPLSGGWWEGQGVTGPDKNIFSPDVSGARELYYYYKDMATGCSNQDKLVMSVWGLPDTTFYTDPQYCVYADALFRPEEKDQGNHFHWDFGDGSGVISVGDTVHAYQMPGFLNVRLITESVHGCLDTSHYRTVEIVNIPPDAEFLLSDTVGCGPFLLNIHVDSTRYRDKNLLFEWDFGNGIKSDTLMPPNPLEYRDGVWDTVYTIRLDVFNRVCEYHRPMGKNITVYSSPDAKFVKQHDWECAPVEVCFHNISTGDRSRYIWLYGDDSVSYEKEGSHLFKGDTVSRTYNITLIAVNSCGRDTFVDPFVVKPQSVHAFFQTPKRDICMGEEICFINHTTEDLSSMINKQWDFGDNSRDTTWDACHVYRQSGKFKVFLYVDNGCGFDTISDYVRIYPLPVLNIQSENELCENDTFHFELKTDLPLQRQEWDFGDTTVSLYQNDQHRYAGYGKRLVKVWALSSSPAVCRGEAEKEIFINPLPVIHIHPLDTAACSPLEYAPSISGEGHLMWDYGDGTELTSAEEHQYINETDEVQYHHTHIYAESDKGCKSGYEGEVIVYNVPRAGIDKKIITLGKPQVVEFINLSEMYDECIWYLPFDKTVRSFDNQQVSFDETELYTASLVAANRYGCRDSVAIEHQVVMKGLFFPNSFIPSSSNPQVSHFNGTGIGLKKYHLVIYDQFNNKVWETRALENGHPSEGWDGRNKNGEMLPQGVYIWRAEATFIDDTEWTGKNADSGAMQTIQGVVLMLKNN